MSGRSVDGNGHAGGGLTCSAAREAISARLDGEDPGADPAHIDSHVNGCAACRAWAAIARQPLPAPQPPDLAPAILRAMAAARTAPPDQCTGDRLAAQQRGPKRAGVRRPVRTATIAAAVVAVAASVGVVAARAVRSGSTPLASTQQVAGSTQTDSRYPGATVLPVGVPKPHLVLTDTAGRPYDLATRTAGRVTLVYFGYTHCPDVCPVNMALAAQALGRMPAAQASKVDVVFVSTDPARDTPPVMRSWLDNFSPSFIGLTGSIDAVEAAETQVGMARSVIATGGPETDGGYQVVHSGFTLVYTQDDASHLQFSADARPAQYATTLERLVTGGYRA